MNPQPSSAISQHFLPHYLQNGSAMARRNTAVIKKRFLVFNANGPSKYTAILRIRNPIACSDVYYKLKPVAGSKLSFQAKSWKGRVGKNNHVDVMIAAMVLSSLATVSNARESSVADLCKTKFSLEMSECSNKWRPENVGGGRCVVKIELLCITRHILTLIQKETTLNMDDLSQSCDDVDNIIAKFVGNSPEVGGSVRCIDTGVRDEQLATIPDSTMNLQQEEQSHESGALSQDFCSDDSSDTQLKVGAPKSSFKKAPRKKQVNKPRSLVSALITLLLLLVDTLMNTLSSSVLFSKQLANKMVLGLSPPKKLANSTEQTVASPNVVK